MTGIFIVARLGSTRLAQKHLIKVAGKTFIEWLVDRFTFSFRKEITVGQVAIFIVTSESKENKEFESLFGNTDIKIFYGSDSNIPLRQLQCALAYGINEIINIDGDDILCSTHAAHIVHEHLLRDAVYTKTKGLPLGMNIIGYRTEFLQSSLNNYKNATLETGWGRIFNDSFATEIQLGHYDEDKKLRFTLDYKEDADFFKAVIELKGKKIIDIDDKTLIGLVVDKEFYKINENVNETYWKNFILQKNAEG